MKIIHTVASLAALTLTLTTLAGCGSHGSNSSPDYQINPMERMDKDTGKDKEKLKRMEKEMQKDK